MSFIVTGAAGFIGANIVKGLNNRGCNDVIAVDNLTQADKFVNLADHHIIDYFDKVDFIEKLKPARSQSPKPFSTKAPAPTPWSTTVTT